MAQRARSGNGNGVVRRVKATGRAPSRAGSRFTLAVPADFVLARDVASYGYFVLAPSRWAVAEQTLECTLDLASGGGPASEFGVVRLVVRQEPGTALGEANGGNGRAGGAAEAGIGRLEAGGPLKVSCDRALAAPERAEARRQISRMLRLDEDEHAVAAFHEVDPRWSVRRGGLGHARLFRSATLFEDVVKTVTSCNVTWGGTVNMNRRLCEVAGRRSQSGTAAFPTARRLARTRPTTLRSRCGVGYRDGRIVELARLFARGEVDEGWLADPANPDDAVFKGLKALPGVGPYAAANIMMLLGRYSRLAVDSECIKHGRRVLGMEGTDAQIGKRLHAHYEAFGAHRFRSYWFETWTHYETRNGPAWTWERDGTGAGLTKG